MSETTEKKADELKAILADADQETAQSILSQETAKEEPRSTVVKAAEDRLAVLAVPGEPQESEPSGVWAQLLDDSGEPVLVDGNPVRAELTP